MTKTGIWIVLGLVAVSAEVRASQCLFEFDSTSSGDLPLGCPVTVISASGPPQVFALRQGVGTVDVTGAITEAATTIELEFFGFNEPCAPDSYMTETAPYTIYTIELANAQEGDALSLGGSDALGTVIAAGTCPGAPAVPESIACDISEPCLPEDMNPPDDDPPDEAGNGGCSTGNSSLFGAIAVLGLLAVRRRRPS